MPANTTPIFINKGNLTPARLLAYNAGTTTSTITVGNFYDLVLGATDGTRVDGVKVIAVGEVAGAATITPAAKVIRVFICNTDNTNHRLLLETTLPSTAISNTAVRSTNLVTFDQPIILKSTQKLIVTMTAGATAFVTGNEIDAIPYAGDY